MKFLIYSGNYAPELTGIGKYNGEMGAWLAARGHEVRVITTPPHYPAWKIWNGYRSTRYSHEVRDGVDVYRAPTWIPKRLTGLKRIIHLLSFAISSIPLLIAQLRWRPDVIFLTEPPLACAINTIIFAKLVGARSVLHIQDYEVDAAFDLGIIRGDRSRRLIERFERFIISRFDVVSSISHRMVFRAISKGVEKQRTAYFPNWVDVSAIFPFNGPNKFRQLVGAGAGDTVALYSGNMGKKQGLETLAEAAKLLRDVGGIRFVFCGEGAGRADFEMACVGLPNVTFLDLQPLPLLNELLGSANVHLLPQKAGAADLVMPSKLTGMLSSGRCVVATTTAETELGSLVSDVARCGLLSAPERADELAAHLLYLHSNPDVSAELGRNGRQFAETQLSVDRVMEKFLQRFAS